MFRICAGFGRVRDEGPGEAEKPAAAPTGESEAAVNEVNPPARKVGRPQGSGCLPEDDALVKKALEMLENGEAKSANDAARKLAGNVNSPRYNANYERLRKKISEAVRSGKNPAP